MKNREYYKNRDTYSELWKEVNETAQSDTATEDSQVEEVVTPPESIEEAETKEPSQVEQKVPEVTQEDAISLSNKIVKILENKVKLHNAKYESKVTLDQLKEVYTSGSEGYEQIDESVVEGWNKKLAIKCDWPVFAMARINSFLRMKRGEKVDPTKQLVKVLASDQELDITPSLLPGNDSLAEAWVDVREINLDDIELTPQDLYLETQKQSEEASSKNFII
jgi:hypothetical protein